MGCRNERDYNRHSLPVSPEPYNTSEPVWIDGQNYEKTPSPTVMPVFTPELTETFVPGLIPHLFPLKLLFPL